MEELIELLCSLEGETKQDFLDLQQKAFKMFDALSPEEQELIVEDNTFEMLSMTLEAFEYEENGGEKMN